MKKYIIISLLLSIVLIACSKDEEKIQFEYVRPDVTTSEFTDVRDGSVYKCIEVNGQVWMAENFRYLPQGSSIYGCYSYNQDPPKESSVTAATVRAAANHFTVKKLFNPQSILDTINYRIDKQSATARMIFDEFEPYFPAPFFAVFSTSLNPFDPVSYKEYGALYTLEAAKKYAPEGWRLPTDEDWSKLEASFGMPKEEIAKLDVWRGEGLARALKEGVDGIGFNAKYAGVKLSFANGGYGTTFFRQGSNAYFWTASEYETDSLNYAITRVLYFKNDAILRGTSIINKVANSVRYIKK